MASPEHSNTMSDPSTISSMELVRYSPIDTVNRIQRAAGQHFGDQEIRASLQQMNKSGGDEACPGDANFREVHIRDEKRKRVCDLGKEQNPSEDATIAVDHNAERSGCGGCERTTRSTHPPVLHSKSLGGCLLEHSGTDLKLPGVSHRHHTPAPTFDGGIHCTSRIASHRNSTHAAQQPFDPAATGVIFRLVWQNRGLESKLTTYFGTSRRSRLPIQPNTHGRDGSATNI